MEKEFKDRIAQYPNRRKLKIVTQTDNEIVADIELADEASQQGTPITAAVLNEMNNEINANKVNSTTALSTANEAKALAEEAKNSVLQDEGTKVLVGGVSQPSWDADSKLDKNQGTINANKTMIVGTNGEITPSNYIYIGNIKVYQDPEGLAFEFPEES